MMHGRRAGFMVCSRFALNAVVLFLLQASVAALEITEVLYGVDGKRHDLTAAFEKTRTNLDLYFAFYDGVQMLGEDPAKGVRKDFLVRYKDDDGNMRECRISDRTLTGLAGNTEEASVPFRLNRAFWGDHGRFTEVTGQIRELVAGGKELVLGNSVLETEDPLPGKRKLLVVFYSIAGERIVDVFREGDRFKGSLINGRFDPIEVLRNIQSPFRGMELDTAVWQWAIPMAGVQNPENGLPSQAFLYVPPKTTKLRGVVVGQYNMLERPIMEHPLFRDYLQKLNYACIWIAPAPFGSQFDFRDPAKAAAFDNLFRDLATVSGYAELAEIPFVGLGHSAMADFPYQLAAWKPQRAICGISYDGSAPGVGYNYSYGENPILNDEAITRIESIPFLLRSGGVGGTTNFRALVVRGKHPKLPLTTIMDPGSGHFDINDDIIDYMGRYLLKADKARGVGAFPLKPVDTNKGWCVDFWRYNDLPQVPPAPASEFQAKKGRYGGEDNWVFDEEHARFHETHEALYRGKKVQLLAYIQGGEVLPDRKDHLQIHPRFVPEADGLSVKLKGGFLDVVTEGRAPGWVGMKAGESIAHGDDPQNIRIYPVCGPVVTLDGQTVAARFDRFGFTACNRTGEACMIAVLPADDTYRRCVLQAEMRVPTDFTIGIRQYIDFPEIQDVPDGTTVVELKAVCNTGLPVEYYVEYGPAFIRDNKLLLTPVPAGAKYPVEIKVVAWQLGMEREPKVRSAKPVARFFHITK